MNHTEDFRNVIETMREQLKQMGCNFDYVKTMENYKAIVFDPYTFIPSEHETNIPKDIVEAVVDGLKPLDFYTITPTLLSKDGTSVWMGILYPGMKLKFKVTIEAVNE